MSNKSVGLMAMLGGTLTIGVLALVQVLGNEKQFQVPRGEAPATNVIWILVDTLRTDHLQTYGYDKHNTSPNIAAFSEHSVVFDNAFTHSPWTKPSVASLMTSRLPRELGIYDWTDGLDLSFLTLAEHLQANGFHTQAHFSNVAFKRDETNFSQGFDVFDGFVLEKGQPHKMSSSREITDAGIRFINRQQHDRFFLWLHYFDPHRDYLPHKEFKFGKDPSDRYDGEIAFTDKHLGRLFDALRDSGRLTDTVVILTSDHGEGLGQHGISRHTSALYDHQIHIPFIVYAPWMSPARRSEVVNAIDIAPTLLSLLNIPIPAEFGGKAIPTTDSGFSPEPNRTSYAETRRFADLGSVIHDGWKLISDQKTGTVELYNFIDDPEESKDWAEHDPERLASMTELLKAYTQAPQRAASGKPLKEETVKELKAQGYIE